MVTLANGGPHSPAMEIAVKPVDYKGGGLSNLSKLGVSSHHRCGLFKIQKRWHFVRTRVTAFLLVKKNTKPH